MALFSQRSGIRPLSKAIQRESIDDELRNALWTSFYETFVQAYYHDTGSGGFPYYEYREEMDRKREKKESDPGASLSPGSHLSSPL